MATSDYEETHLVEELDGQKILSAQLIHGPDGDRLMLGLEGNEQVIIRPGRGHEVDHLQIEVLEAPEIS